MQLILAALKTDFVRREHIPGYVPERTEFCLRIPPLLVDRICFCLDLSILSCFSSSQNNDITNNKSSSELLETDTQLNLKEVYKAFCFSLAFKSLQMNAGPCSRSVRDAENAVL